MPNGFRQFIVDTHKEFAGGAGLHPHFFPWDSERNELLTKIKAVYAVYGENDYRLFPHFVYVNDDETWESIIKDKSIIPYDFRKEINKYEAGEDFVGLTTKIWSNEISDDFYASLGFFKRAKTLIEALQQLCDAIRDRVENREKIDILG